MTWGQTATTTKKLKTLKQQASRMINTSNQSTNKCNKLYSVMPEEMTAKKTALNHRNDLALLQKIYSKHKI